MGDDVVQLSGDPCPLFHDGLARDEIPFTLCDLRPSLPVADDATNEQDHDQRDDCERDASFRLASDRDRHECRQRDRRRAGRKEPRRRPDSQGVHRAQPSDAKAHDVGRFPRDRDDVGEEGGGDTGTRGIPAAHGDGPGHQRPGNSDDEPLPPRNAAEPRLELRPDGEGRREDDIELDRAYPEAAETQKARGHAPKVDRRERRVIRRSADPTAPKDPPID